jgi:hypothetical protein
VCGTLAAEIDGPAEVTLRNRPPLGRAIGLIADTSGARLVDGDILVAEVRRVDVTEVDIPSLQRLSRRSQRRWPAMGITNPQRHQYPECFVCGPGRTQRDGLRILTGPVSGRPGLQAAPWTPDSSLGDGMLDDVFVWASLDCPSAHHFDLLADPTVYEKLRGWLRATDGVTPDGENAESS